MKRLRSGVACSMLLCCWRRAAVAPRRRPRRRRPPPGNKTGRPRTRCRPKRRRVQRRASSRWSRTTRPTTGPTRRARQVAKAFHDAAAHQKSTMQKDMPEALYNAGLAYQRCNKDAEAKAQFRAGAQPRPEVPPRPRADRALRPEGEGRRRDGAGHPRAAAGRHRRAVPERPGARQPGHAPDEARAARTPIRTAPTTSIARRRTSSARSPSTTATCPPSTSSPSTTSRWRSRRPAAAGKSARRRPFAKHEEGRPRAQLELAALVCSQAIRKNPNYAAIHNTAGLIQVELQDINSAVAGVPDGGQARSEVLRSADELRGGQPLVPRVRAGAKTRTATRSRCARTTTTRTSASRSPCAVRSTTRTSTRYVADAPERARRGKRLAPDRAETLLQRSHPDPGVQGQGRRQRTPCRCSSRRRGIFESFIQKAGSAPEFAAR